MERRTLNIEPNEFNGLRRAITSGEKGYVVLRDFPKRLKLEFPEYEFFLATKTDQHDGIAEAHWAGWRAVKLEHFGCEGIEDFNRDIGSRFGLHIKDGIVCIRDYYLMAMPKDLRKEIMDKRNAATEERYLRQIGAYEGKAEQHRATAIIDQDTGETHVTSKEDVTSAPKKRGRPRRNT